MLETMLELSNRITHLERQVDRLASTDPQEARELREELANARAAYRRELDLYEAAQRERQG